MPASTVLRFRDPDEYHMYARSLGGSVKTTIATPGEYAMDLTAINLETLFVTRSQVSLPRIIHHGFPTGLTSFILYTDDDHPPSLVNGQEASPDRLIIAPAGSDTFSRSYTELTSGAVGIAPERLAAESRILLGYDLCLSRSVRLAQLPRKLLLRLRHLHAAVCHLAATVPDVLAHPEVARAMEQQLFRALVHCLTDRAADAGNTRFSGRTSVMRRFEDVLNANPNTPLYLPEVCARIGVSDRTLRLYCVDHLGVSPHHYLWLRRMNLARFALARADPDAMTVTGIAMEFGFGELGRFSVAYRRLFDETPSTTLRRPPYRPAPVGLPAIASGFPDFP